jgi:HPt (histidine-containing phosphotransfer) domain-containing protein
MANHIDNAALNELKGILEDDFNLLVETYISDTDGRISRLEQGIADQDAEMIKTVAHSIKGSSSNLFANVLTALCQKVEDKGRSGALEGLDPLFEEIKTEYQHVRDELSQLL